ncbi:hypothetical protein D3C84_780610 [compost metagenome]
MLARSIEASRRTNQNSSPGSLTSTCLSKRSLGRILPQRSAIGCSTMVRWKIPPCTISSTSSTARLGSTHSIVTGGSLCKASF